MHFAVEICGAIWCPMQVLNCHQGRSKTQQAGISWDQRQSDLAGWIPNPSIHLNIYLLVLIEPREMCSALRKYPMCIFIYCAFKKRRQRFWGSVYLVWITVLFDWGYWLFASSSIWRTIEMSNICEMAWSPKNVQNRQMCRFSCISGKRKTVMFSIN